MPDRYEPDPDIAAFNKKVDRTCDSIDDTMQVLIHQAKAQRRYALLQAAATILSMHTGETYSAVVDAAEKILAEIERRDTNDKTI